MSVAAHFRVQLPGVKDAIRGCIDPSRQEAPLRMTVVISGRANPSGAKAPTWFGSGIGTAEAVPFAKPFGG